MNKNFLNSFYLLPKNIEPYFYNDLIKIKEVPIFNELKKNYNDIKKEVLDSFNYISKIEGGDFLYSGLGDYVLSKEKNISVENVILGYSLIIDDLFFNDLEDLTLDQKQKINIMLNIKKINAKNYNEFLTGNKILQNIENKIESITEEDKEKINTLLKLKKMSPISSLIINDLYNEKILTTCIVSRIKPNSYIKAHNDPVEKDTLRVHYCLTTDSLCTLTVGKETRQWKENDFLIFNPNGQHKHSVNHDGEKDRIIMIFDLKKSYLQEYYKND